MQKFWLLSSSLAAVPAGPGGYTHVAVLLPVVPISQNQEIVIDACSLRVNAPALIDANVCGVTGATVVASIFDNVQNGIPLGLIDFSPFVSSAAGGLGIAGIFTPPMQKPLIIEIGENMPPGIGIPVAIGFSLNLDLVNSGASGVSMAYSVAIRYGIGRATALSPPVN